MHRKWIPRLSVFAVLVSLAGCFVPVGVVYTESDNGRSVTLPTSTVFTVKLASNPSTGYSWTLLTHDTTVVVNTGNQYIASGSATTGSGGYEEWTFITAATGVTTIRMEYVQAGASTVAETFEITITVGSSTSLVFTESDNGRVVTLPAGTHFTVKLESNRSTGYAWTLLSPTTSAVVAHTGNEYIAPTSALPGASGYEQWYFVTESSGTATVWLEYVQSGVSGSTPAQLFQLAVTVP